MEKRKVLLIVNHYKDRSPGQRFRIEQYIEHLEKNGYEVKFSNFIDRKYDKVFYKKGNIIKKSFYAIKSILQRIQDTRDSKNYDVVFVFREAINFGFTWFERQISKNSKIIFDFDDAIWLTFDNSRASNKRLQWLKNPAKTAELIKLSSLICAGNDYLANYARGINQSVVIVPTTIDTEMYTLKPEYRKKDKVCIGWSGSFSTIVHFEFSIPFLTLLKEKYGDKIYFKVIGDGNYVHEGLGIKGQPWKMDTEIEDLSEIDIGIMPLPDDEWSKGKCGLKGLQYMALNIPTLMSPVGVNSEIIEDGENGFLASEKEEWVEKLSLLIESEELRKSMGDKGRKTVVDKYSVTANEQLYLDNFNGVFEGKYSAKV